MSFHDINIARESVQVKEKTGKGRACHPPVEPYADQRGYGCFSGNGGTGMQSAKKMCGYGREITKAGLGSLAFHTDGLALDP
ncbi:MAG: hypothetical protein OXD45_04945 [Rhodobacteraceae bacterium]|nr:hypothetical protein [Paracoccaceae bacterium]